LDQGPLAAVILFVVVGAKLEAVVGATYQVPLATSMAVIVAAISGPITVTLTLVTGGLRSTAPPAVVIPTNTSLTCRRLQGYGGLNQGPLAAVILLVVVGAKLEAVVGATYQVSLAASVAVIAAAIPGPVTVTLTLVTGGLRSTAPLAIIIPPSTSLTCRRLQGDTNCDLGPLAAVILLVVVGAKLEAVVGATYQVSLAASVAVIAAAIPGPVTVTLTLVTGGLRSTASLAIIIPPSTSLTWRRLQAQRLRDS